MNALTPEQREIVARLQSRRLMICDGQGDPNSDGCGGQGYTGAAGQEPCPHCYGAGVMTPELRVALASAPSPEAGAGGDLFAEAVDIVGTIKRTYSAGFCISGELQERMSRFLKLVASTGSGKEETKGFQSRNATWMEIAFEGDPTDLPERVARFGEEALELQQALGQSREDAHRLVDYVYSRPIGRADKEMGGTLTTLACLAVATGIDMATCGEDELARVSTPEFIAKLRAKRATRHGRGPLPGFSAPGTSEPEATPQSAPSQTPVDPQMTVEEARDLLLSLPRFASTDACVESLHLQALRARSPDAAKAFRNEADRIKAALRTLQAAGEVR